MSSLCVGVDEVGRGCWAGPLVIGAVILSDERPIDGLKDSKLLSKLSRQGLAAVIKQFALAWSLGWVAPQEIDDLGLTGATTLAIERALEQIDLDYSEIIIDGSVNYLKANPLSRSQIKADQTVPVVSAASIIAKVARDRYMSQMAKLYPAYGFDKHVGYGTLEHQSSLKLHGACPLHRLSFKPVKLISQAA